MGGCSSSRIHLALICKSDRSRTQLQTRFPCDGTSDVQYYLKRASISEYNHLAPDETHVSVFASNIVQSTLVNDVNTMAMAEAMGWKTE